MTACAVVLVLLLAASWRFVASRGVFTSAKSVSPGACRTIAGPQAAGALAVDAADKLVFIAAASGRRASPQDGLYAYAYEKPGAGPQKIAGLSVDFHPIALSLHRDSAGTTLMAINRRSGGDFAIDVFAVLIADGTPKLTEVGAITGDVLVDPAGLAAADSTRFYVVNRHLSRTALGRWLDSAFVLPRADILYFDGIKFTEVAKQMVDPVGAALSADATMLYVAEDFGRTLVSFRRNPFSGQLENAGTLAVGSGLQQLSVGPDGGVWIAAQPKAFAVNAFRRDAGAPAPSQVFRAAVSNGLPQAATLVYSGTEIGAASAAAVVDDRLLIGSALDHGLLDCRIAD